MSSRPMSELVFPTGVSKSRSQRHFHSTVAFLVIGVIAAGVSAPAQTATTTSLTVTLGGNPVASVAQGTMITLTASVTSGSTAVKQGQVNFCDASAAHCTDIHLLGAAQLNSSGKARLQLRPGVGSFSYRAIFLGTPSTAVPYAGSMSTSSSLTVTGEISTATLITQSGPATDYTLRASVLGFTKQKTLPTPTGTISFVDTTTSNSVLGTASLSAVSGPGWLNTSNSTVGSLPANLVPGDFNGDGNLDLAVGINSVSGSGTVSASVLLGDGLGNFAPPSGSAVIAGGVPLAVADFNQDGIPDLLLSDKFNQLLTVMLGNGDGTFTAAPGGPLSTRYGVFPVAVGDFNGDGVPDIASAGAYYMIVWLGNGDGTFAQMPITGSTYFPADSFYSMVVGDFNGDGNADLAAAYLGGAPIAILLGNGDGTFTKGTPISTTVASSLALGDFDGDGKLDLAAPGPGNSISIFLGNGDGTFHAASGSPVPVGQSPNLVATADFNGDGIADLIVNGATSLTDVSVLLGNGDGTFAPTSTGDVRLPCCSNIVVGDFNGDGVSDFATSDFYNGTADVFLTGAKQASASVTGITIAGQTPQNVVASYPGDGNYGSSQSVPTALLVPASPPVFVPASGGVIAITQTITLTSSTPGVGIYYQASGALQTNAYVQYVGPIQIFGIGGLSIQAYAASADYGQSATTTATYTVVSSYPVPVLASLSPASTAAGGPEFTLTISGSNFASSSTAFLGTTALSTQFVGTTQLTAAVPSAQIAAAGAQAISVQTPSPGGGTSNQLQLEIDSGGGTPPSFTTTSATVSAGASATYAVTLSSSATNVSVKCLNLPNGATCSYTSGTGLTITTSSSTPLGTYPITAVFTETLPGALSAALAVSLFLPLGFSPRIRRHRRTSLWILILGFSALLELSCGGGGSNTQPQTHQATTSGVVTLTVQ